MNGQIKTGGFELPKLIVLVERHLQAELGLLEKLDLLNLTLKTSLEASGSRGLTKPQTDELDGLAEDLSTSASELKVKRAKVLAAVNVTVAVEADDISIRQFIQSLNEPHSSRLESIRIAILDRLTEAHATLIGNQAVMFYSYDFFRKMVAGLLNNDLDENQYSENGQQAGVQPGNFYRKAV